MKRIQHDFWQWEASIDPEFCDSTIAKHFADSEKTDGIIYNSDTTFGPNEQKRKTNLAWAKVGTEIFDTVFDYITSANQSAGWYFDITGMEDVQIGEYTDGGHYEWHADKDNPCEEGYQRKISCSVQLSDPDSYEGGDLILETPDGQQHIAPRQKGSVVVFPSFLKHKVTSVTKGTRYSAVGWMRGPAFR